MAFGHLCQHWYLELCLHVPLGFVLIIQLDTIPLAVWAICALMHVTCQELDLAYAELL